MTARGDGRPEGGHPGRHVRATYGLAGLVLCGGESSRMGTDKARIVVGGWPLVELVAGRLSMVADPVLLASGTAGRLADVGLTEVGDEAPFAGPLAGLAAGLRASPHELVAVAAVDMPFASARLFALLAEMHGGEDAVVPVTARGREPLHAVYSRSALAALSDALHDGRRSAVDVLGRLRVREVDEHSWRRADPSGRFALNLNRPEDLAALRASFAAPGPEASI